MLKNLACQNKIGIFKTLILIYFVNMKSADTWNRICKPDFQNYIVLFYSTVNDWTISYNNLRIASVKKGLHFKYQVQGLKLIAASVSCTGHQRCIPQPTCHEQWTRTTDNGNQDLPQIVAFSDFQAKNKIFFFNRPFNNYHIIEVFTIAAAAGATKLPFYKYQHQESKSDPTSL